MGFEVNYCEYQSYSLPNESLVRNSDSGSGALANITSLLTERAVVAAPPSSSGGEGTQGKRPYQPLPSLSDRCFPAFRRTLSTLAGSGPPLQPHATADNEPLVGPLSAPRSASLSARFLFCARMEFPRSKESDGHSSRLILCSSVCAIQCLLGSGIASGCLHHHANCRSQQHRGFAAVYPPAPEAVERAFERLHPSGANEPKRLPFPTVSATLAGVVAASH